MPAKTLGPQKGWIVKSYIGWRREWSISYEGVETSPPSRHILNPREEARKEDNMLAVGLACYTLL